MKVIYCVGETQLQRDRDQTNAVIEKQLREGLVDVELNSDQLVIAYEPIWSIGTGKIPNRKDLLKTTIYIKKVLKNIFKKNSPAVLYGGSVDGNNIDMFKQIKEIDGFLVGGASQNSNANSLPRK